MHGMTDIGQIHEGVRGHPSARVLNQASAYDAGGITDRQSQSGDTNGGVSAGAQHTGWCKKITLTEPSP